jgi:hypothetical protein
VTRGLATRVSPARVRALLAVSFVGYGALTLVAWVYAAATQSAHSPLLSAIALPCGVLALTTGLLLRRRSRWTMAAMIGWAICLVALNILTPGG